MSRVIKVKIEGKSRITMNVIIGEYHSQAEYSAVIKSERVRNPEYVVLEWAMSV